MREPYDCLHRRHSASIDEIRRHEQDCDALFKDVRKNPSDGERGKDLKEQIRRIAGTDGTFIGRDVQERASRFASPFEMRNCLAVLGTQQRRWKNGPVSYIHLTLRT